MSFGMIVTYANSNTVRYRAENRQREAEYAFCVDRLGRKKATVRNYGETHQGGFITHKLVSSKRATKYLREKNTAEVTEQLDERAAKPKYASEAS